MWVGTYVKEMQSRMLYFQAVSKWQGRVMNHRNGVSSCWCYLNEIFLVTGSNKWRVFSNSIPRKEATIIRETKKNTKFPILGNYKSIENEHLSF